MDLAGEVEGAGAAGGAVAVDADDGPGAGASASAMRADVADAARTPIAVQQSTLMAAGALRRFAPRDETGRRAHAWQATVGNAGLPSRRSHPGWYLRWRRRSLGGHDSYDLTQPVRAADPTLVGCLLKGVPGPVVRISTLTCLLGRWRAELLA